VTTRRLSALSFNAEAGVAMVGTYSGPILLYNTAVCSQVRWH
jgi:hypothetical protein